MMAQVNAGRVRFVGRGEYNNSTQYYVFDLISYNGNSYYAKVDTIGNLPTNTTYWQLVAEKGNVGPTGPTGNGIASVTKTGTSGLVDTYTITFTNGNTTTFDVTNGKGISRIEKTATIDNVDTYTIYFNDNTTTTFEVANGEVTKEELEEEVDRLSMIYNLFPTTSDEDTKMTLNGTGEVTFKKFDLKANTLQDGTPTPDSPVPVQVVSGNNSIKVEGKNLLLPKASTSTKNGVTFTKNNDGTYTVNGTATANAVFSILAEGDTTNPTLSTGTYTLSGCPSDGDSNTYKLDISVGSYNQDTGNGVTFTLSEATQINYVRILVYNGQTINKVFKPMLEKSSTATTYTPYTSQTYPINLGNIELCKIGDYKDRIYKFNDKWYIEKKIGKVVLEGATSENWAQNSSQTQTNTNYFSSNVIDNLLKSGEKNGVSNYFTVVNELWNIDIQGIQFSTSSSNIRLRINKTIASDLSTFKTWLSNNNTTVYYILSTPTITEITDTVLIEQLENLQKAYSYDTQTNISQTNTDMPFIIDVEALMSLKNVLNT